MFLVTTLRVLVMDSGPRSGHPVRSYAERGNEGTSRRSVRSTVVRLLQHLGGLLLVAMFVQIKSQALRVLQLFGPQVVGLATPLHGPRQVLLFAENHGQVIGRRGQLRVGLQRGP